MISVVVIFCIATMVASAPSDVRPVINSAVPDSRQVQASAEPHQVTSVNFPSQTTDDKMKSKRMFDDGYTGFQPNYLPVSPLALPAAYHGVPYGFRNFPTSYFPAYYPAYYEDKYGFGDNYEIKSDITGLQDALDDELRTGSSSTSGSNTPTTPTNPMAPFFNTLIAINNMNILKLLLANKAMLILG